VAVGPSRVSQDKFLLRNDNVLPATLQRIKKELDLQRAISDAQQKLKQAMDSYAPYEVRMAALESGPRAHLLCHAERAWRGRAVRGPL
jgi:hypothetical protein